MEIDFKLTECDNGMLLAIKDDGENTVLVCENEAELNSIAKSEKVAACLGEQLLHFINIEMNNNLCNTVKINLNITPVREI